VIDALTGQGIDVRHACRTLGVSESGYYAWKDRPTSPRELRRIWLAGEIVDVHKASGGTYGATRVRAELIYGRGIHVGHNAVELIMRRLGIKGLPTRRLPRGARLARITSLDLVGRQFRVLLTFPWVGERLLQRGSGGQRPASESIASAIRAPGL